MKKKLLTALSAVCALSLMLGGCAKDKGTSADDNSFEWLMFCSGPADEDAPVKKFYEEEFGVKFNVWYIERSKWDELLNVRFASGEIPDVFPIAGSVPLRKYVEQGIVAELPKEFLKENAPEFYAWADGLGEEAWKYTAIDGKNYSVPSQNFDNQYHTVSVWRDDWLKNVGIDKIPETLDEFEEAFYKFRNEDPDGNGIKDTYAVSDKGIFNSMFGAYGYLPRDMGGVNAMWKDRDGKLVYAAVQPEMKEALARFAKWYKDGIIDPEIVSGENTSGHWSLSQAFINGRIGYTVSGMHYHVSPPLRDNDIGSAFYRNFKQLQGENATYAYGRPPIGPDGGSGNFQAPVISGGGAVFGKQLEKNKEKYKKLLNIFNELNTNDKYKEISTCGIEGVHWDRDENGEIMSREGFQKGAELAKIGANNIFYGHFINQIDTPREVTMYEFADKVGKYAGIADQLREDLPSEMKYNSMLDKARETAYIQIITGEKPIEYFDEWVKIWEENGGLTLEKEANEWYDTIK